MLKNNPALPALALEHDINKSAFDAVKLVKPLVLAGCAPRMFIARRSHAEFVQAGNRVHGVILPVAVAADDKEVISHISLNPVAQFLAFVVEACVGMVVRLVE